ncbi:MAG: IclR family transcriptional regulator [Pseudomonadota bacterium]
MSALTKGFRILEATAHHGDGLSFSEVVRETGLAKATVHRLLNELVELTALTYDSSSRRYKGGLALASLGAAVTANYDIRRIARPILEKLHAETGYVTTLGVRNGKDGTYIDKIEPKDLIVRLHSEVGKSFPLHCTAMGKVLLAHADAATVSAVLRRRLEQYTSNTITDTKKLRNELESVAARGYAVDDEEITRGLTCVAAPIFDTAGQVNAAVSCTLSSFDATPELIASVAERVVAGAQQASGNFN